MTFQKLNLISPLMKAIEGEGYENPTPIQENAIPSILERRDLLASAETGTGKTAAFVLPMLQILAEDGKSKNEKKKLRALILAPTRELAVQIGDNIRTYSKYVGVRHTLIYGGVSQRTQTDALRKGVDIAVATPGRFLDLMDQGHIDLSNVEMLVLDESDRMLDMGFIHDIKSIINELPQKKQTLFFSATISSEIERLSKTLLTDPVRIEVPKAQRATPKIEEKIFFVEKKNKKDLLLHILEGTNRDSVLIFTGTKIGAEKMAKELTRIGIRSEAIHGGKTQNFRQRALDNFHRNKVKILVATDVAARGIDVEGLPYVINYNLPNESETYVHRIGRTGRAGAEGVALSLCDEEDLSNLYQIEKLIGKKIENEENHPFTSEKTIEMSIKRGTKGGGGSSRNGRRNSGGPRRFGRNESSGNGRGFGRERNGSQDRERNGGQDRERRFSGESRNKNSQERNFRNGSGENKPTKSGSNGEQSSNKSGFYSGKNKKYASRKRY